MKETGRHENSPTLIRMTLQERIQHWVLIACFGLLILTGLPIFLHDLPFFERLFFFREAFHIRGILHRTAAVMLMGLAVYHFLYILINKKGRRNFRAMRPKAEDLSHLITSFMYNLGLMRALYRRGYLRNWLDHHPTWRFDRPPRYGRYNFIEKFEYWAVAWGSLVMILTGLALWFPVQSLRLFSLPVHQVIRVIHSFEATLAFLAVLIWHMYTVHLRPEVFPMSRIWLDGKITLEELARDHPLEHEELMKNEESGPKAAPNNC